jgi:hypothetical protein
MFPSASPLPGRRTPIMALALTLSLAAAAWPASLEKALVLSGMERGDHQPDLRAVPVKSPRRARPVRGAGERYFKPSTRKSVDRSRKY